MNEARLPSFRFRGHLVRIVIGTCLDNRVLCGRSDPAAASVWACRLAPQCPFAATEREREREGRVRISIFHSWDDAAAALAAPFSSRRGTRFISSATPKLHPIHSYFWEDLRSGRNPPNRWRLQVSMIHPSAVRLRPSASVRDLSANRQNATSPRLIRLPPVLLSASLPPAPSSISVHWQIGSGIGLTISLPPLSSPH